MRVRPYNIARWFCGFGSAILCLLPSDISHSQTASAERVTNIRKAAAELAAVEKADGFRGGSALVAACYKRELVKAASLTLGIEACMTQDIINSSVAAQVFGRVSAESRRMAGVQDPKAITQGMVQRVTDVYRRFRAPEADGIAFNRLVQSQGMEAYGRVRFPEHFSNNK